jgi:hypothetical protein
MLMEIMIIIDLLNWWCSFWTKGDRQQKKDKEQKNKVIIRVEKTSNGIPVGSERGIFESGIPSWEFLHQAFLPLTRHLLYVNCYRESPTISSTSRNILVLREIAAHRNNSILRRCVPR